MLQQTVFVLDSRFLPPLLKGVEPTPEVLVLLDQVLETKTGEQVDAWLLNQYKVLLRTCLMTFISKPIALEEFTAQWLMGVAKNLKHAKVEQRKIYLMANACVHFAHVLEVRMDRLPFNDVFNFMHVHYAVGVQTMLGDLVA